LIKQLWTLISVTLLVSLCTGAAAQSWVKVGAADRKIGLYLDTDSVRGLEGGIRVSVSVLNYSRATGEEESLLAGTLHDCRLNLKRDQFVRKALLHWGVGKLVDISGEEKDWLPIKKGSMGAALQRAVCE
jgi:hypothetical protein